MSSSQISSREVQRFLDKGMDMQRAIAAAAADAKSEKLPAVVNGQVSTTVFQPGQRQARPRELEHAEQRAFFYHVRKLEVEVPVLKLAHAVPNGGARSKRTAGRLWAEGVRSGPPDVYLDVARQNFHGFRLELKAPGNEARTSDDQRWWHAQLRREGYFVTVEDTWEKGWNALVWYLGLDNRYLQPMRGDSA